MLFIHTQTVNYRMSRIQELTGRSLRSTGDVSELWFALRALALSQTTQ
jgi:purine catabolism regulator